MKNLCVFGSKSDMKTGGKVFWYSKTEAGDAEFDNNYIKVFPSVEAEKPIVICHKDMVVGVTEDMTEIYHGSLYIKSEHIKLITD
jgi:hypothetical protein